MSAIEDSKRPKKDRSEYMRQLYARKREHFRETGRKRQAAWREKNREKIRATQQRDNGSEKFVARRKRYRDKNPDAPYKAHRKFALRKRYKITPEQWDAMFAAQGSACANLGCGITEPGKSGWHTDHCHATGQLRAILCRWCNHALGMVKDSPEVLRGLADYVEKHRGTVDGPICLTFPPGWNKKKVLKMESSKC